MNRKDFLENVEQVAASYRNAGYEVQIDDGLPTVGVSYKGRDVFFCQDEEAQNFIEQCPEDINEEDYILFVLDSAGVLDEQ